MGLVTNSKSSLYGGVNQQSAEHRLQTQVKECVNGYPTIDSGLIKRNPTKKLNLDSEVLLNNDMWIYNYDRGLSGDSEEKYSMQLSKDGMDIIDVNSGEVFNLTNGRLVCGNDAAKDYVFPFAGKTGYSAITIKDTTFLVNKHVNPRMVYKSYYGLTTGSETKYTETLAFSPTSTVTFNANLLAPYRMKKYTGRLKDPYLQTNTFIVLPTKERTDINGVVATKIPFTLGGQGQYIAFTIYDFKSSTITITVDSYSTSYKVDFESQFDPAYKTSNCLLSSREAYHNWITNIKTRVTDMLPFYEYRVNLNYDNTIEIIKYDGTAITLDVSIDMDTSDFRTLPSNFIIESTSTVEPIESDYYDGATSDTTSETIVIENTTYAKTGFIWVQGSNSTSAYDYNATITDSLGNSVVVTASETTTEAAAASLAALIDADTNFSAIANSSVIKITSDATGAELLSVETSDSYGNQAMFGWGRTVANATDLPKNLGFNYSVVFVEGDITSSFKGYWLIYEDGKWKETLAPNIETVIDSTTMPHIISRGFDSNGDIQFTVTQWDQWVDRVVGDDESNPLPSFMSDNNTIKDIFFLKNRLGFITQRNVIFSEVGEYGNFFRTTAATLLDSDRIDTVVDSIGGIQLEYATFLENALMLFSDKNQFKLEGGTILSPKSIQISQTNAYEINKNIRPIFMNNKIFFCVKRGDNTAVMQYHIYGDGRISEAIDITAHAQTYIPADVKTLTGNSANNMLFLTSESTKNTIYVYKYLDSGNDRVQSAWFKWEYNGEIYGAFSLGRNLNILINRYDNSAVDGWAIGEGVWNGDEGALETSDNFEIQLIHPIDHRGYFVDASEFAEDTTVVENITSTAASSDLMYTCNVQMLYASTVALNNTDILTYVIEVETENGETYTATDEELVLPRDPSDFVTSITVTINDAFPIIFTGISFLYDSTAYATDLLYNGSFSHGIERWVFTDWTINYGIKELGSIIPTYVDLDEWVLYVNGQSRTDGTLKMKSCQINSEDGSDFELQVSDVQRGTSRTINSLYTVNRKPMIYGDSKNVRLAITNNSEKGFRINSILLEGQFNSRSKRTY